MLLKLKITYLKINYKLLDTGRLIRKIHSSTIRRERNRISNTFPMLYSQRRITLVDIINFYRSWRYSYIKYDSKDEIYRLDMILCGIFNLPYESVKRNYKATEIVNQLGGI